MGPTRVQDIEMETSTRHHWKRGMQGGGRKGAGSGMSLAVGQPWGPLTPTSSPPVKTHLYILILLSQWNL